LPAGNLAGSLCQACGRNAAFGKAQLALAAVGQDIDCLDSGAVLERLGNLLQSIPRGIENDDLNPTADPRQQRLNTRHGRIDEQELATGQFFLRTAVTRVGVQRSQRSNQAAHRRQRRLARIHDQLGLKTGKILMHICQSRTIEHVARLER